jgi:signal transduction histidine kinase
MPFSGPPRAPRTGGAPASGSAWEWVVFQALRSLGAGLLIADGGRVVFANESAGEALGIDPPLLHGRRLQEVLPGCPSETAPAPGTDGERSTCRIRRPDGKEAVLTIQGVEVPDRRYPGRSPYLVVLLRDSSQTETLRAERDRLVRLAAVGEVLPSILHELKNPLAAVSTTVEVLLEEVGEGPVQEQLHAVLSEVRRMKLTFEGIGLANQGLRSARMCAVDFAIIEAFRVLAAPARNKGIETRTEVPSLPTLPFNDAVIRAIVFNLVTNSIYACREGDSITVTARLTRLGRDLVMTVADTGCGMTPEVLSRCKELFFTTRPNGSGIGLALCQSVIEKIGGELAIRSEEGRGTVVAATLPISGELGR